MKDFYRKDGLLSLCGLNCGLLSLCGLNCGLCSMKLGGHCPGCGFGNRGCPIARCSLENGAPEYCFQCEKYPCSKYESIEEYDSFITHARQKADLAKARRIGVEAYDAEQEEKVLLFFNKSLTPASLAGRRG